MIFAPSANQNLGSWRKPDFAMSPKKKQRTGDVTLGQVGVQAKPRARPAVGAVEGGVKSEAFRAHTDLNRWPCARDGRLITVGSDCSGLDSVAEALKQMGLGGRVQFEFCSEKEPSCRRFLRSVHGPKRIYKDIVGRDVARMPHVDIYTAGFPCQAFSRAGLNQGREDPHGRGTLLDDVAKYIATKRPNAFLLENMIALTSKTHRKVFDDMLRTLRASGLYFISWRSFNALDFGLPQNRHRVFILGLLRTAVRVQGFPWPKPQQKTPLPLTLFLCGGSGVRMLEPRPGTSADKQRHLLLKRIVTNGGNPKTMPFVLDIFAGRSPHYMFDKVPCLTRNRAGSGGFYISCLSRCLTVEEMLNLQGLPISYLERARACGVTDRQLALMVGNAIPTIVLQALLCRIITKLGSST